MTLLAFGIALFALPHFFSSLMPSPRDRLMARFGEGTYKGLYAAATGLGLVLMIVAYFLGRNSGDMLYTPASGVKHLTMLLATIGIVLISSSHGKSHLKLWLRNPMSIGIALWSVGHLLSVGKTAAVWFWIVMLAVALIDIIVCTVRGKRPTFQPTLRSDMIGLVVGLVLTALFVFLLHPYAFGVRVVG